MDMLPYYRELEIYQIRNYFQEHLRLDNEEVAHLVAKNLFQKPTPQHVEELNAFFFNHIAQLSYPNNRTLHAHYYRRTGCGIPRLKRFTNMGQSTLMRLIKEDALYSSFVTPPPRLLSFTDDPEVLQNILRLLKELNIMNGLHLPEHEYVPIGEEWFRK